MTAKTLRIIGGAAGQGPALKVRDLLNATDQAMVYYRPDHCNLHFEDVEGVRYRCPSDVDRPSSWQDESGEGFYAQATRHAARNAVRNAVFGSGIFNTVESLVSLIDLSETGVRTTAIMHLHSDRSPAGIVNNLADHTVRDEHRERLFSVLNEIRLVETERTNRGVDLNEKIVLQNETFENHPTRSVT